MLKVFMLFMLLVTATASAFSFLKASPGAIILTESNSIIFNQPVKAEYVAKKQAELLLKNNKLPKSQPMYLVLDTPGGSVMDGLLFIDVIKSLNRPVHTITIFAASMGYQMVQSLGTRYILSSGTLMSHRGAISGLSGQVPGELNARLSFFEKILHRMNTVAATRVGMSVSEYQSLIINELWVDGEEAVAKNHADAIANVSCDKELSSKTYSESVMTIFGPVSVTFSKCPLISGPIGVKLGEGVKAEHLTEVKRIINEGRKIINLTF